MPPEQEEPILRMAASPLAAKTLDVENRTVEIVISTETPVNEWDYREGKYLPTVLRASGIKHSGQVPLLDTHSRYSVSSVIGSVRNIRVEDNKLIGEAHYATTAAGEEAFTLAREGHLTDYSIGCVVREAIYEGKGDKMQKVVTTATLMEVSNCPVGADASAKMRAAAAVENQQPPPASPQQEPSTQEVNRMSDATNTVDAEAIKRQAVAEQKEILEICRSHGLDAAEMLGRTVAEVKDAALKRHAEANKPQVVSAPAAQTVIRAGADQADHLIRGAEHALLARHSMTSDDKEGEKIAREFRLSLMTPSEIAREVLRAKGQNAFGDRVEVMQRAISTADFSTILANIANKSVKEGWGLAETSWRKWCQVGSVTDFKQITMTRALATTQGFREVKEGGEYKLDSRSEEKEVFAIKKYGDRIAYTYEAMKNDDLNQLVDSGILFGEMAAHLIEALAVAELTANANMGDGVALFNAAHGNLLSGAGTTITEANLDLARQKFKKQKEGLRFLNISPKFLLAPVELQLTADKLLNSASFSDGGADSNRVNTVANMIAAGDRIYTPYLSGTAWYLAAPRNTVKVFFMDGKQVPTLEQKVGYETDGIDFKARFEVGAKAMDWRGLLKGEGNA